MFYAFRINFALNSLNINVSDIQPAYRQAMQQIGKKSRLSPQEVALYIATQLPVIYRHNLDAARIERWIQRGKIHPREREVRGMLIELGLFDLLP